MIKTSKASAVVLAFTLASAGCAVAPASDDDSCLAAADHINACLGEEIAIPPDVCNADEAEKIIETDCATLAADGSKAFGDTLWCSVTAGYGWGCSAAPAPEPQLLDSVYGRVTDRNGYPKMNVLVGLEGPTYNSALTDYNGQFTMTRMMTGDYRATVREGDYVQTFNAQLTSTCASASSPCIDLQVYW